jgi:diguanylate cyclase (GGDEF)-like protein
MEVALAKEQKNSNPEGRPKLIIELKELDEVYSRFKKIFILSNILTVLLSTYVIASILYPKAFEEQFLRWHRMSLVTLLCGSIILCIAQWLFMLHTTHSSRRTIEELTFMDALTNVYNYRYLDRRLDEEIRVSKRFHTTLSLIYVDLDKFKDINDEHGHQTGNIVLTEIGHILKVASRATDLVGRMGGDEFLLILPNSSSDEAQIVGERIREKLATHTFNIDNAKVAFAGVSLGVATYPIDAKCKETLIAAADQAMYRAKQSGGNRICI